MTDQISSKTLGKVLTSRSYKWTSAMVADLIQFCARFEAREAADQLTADSQKLGLYTTVPAVRRRGKLQK